MPIFETSQQRAQFWATLGEPETDRDPTLADLERFRQAIEQSNVQLESDEDRIATWLKLYSRVSAGLQAPSANIRFSNGMLIAVAGFKYTAEEGTRYLEKITSHFNQTTDADKNVFYLEAGGTRYKAYLLQDTVDLSVFHFIWRDMNQNLRFATLTWEIPNDQPFCSALMRALSDPSSPREVNLKLLLAARAMDQMPQLVEMAEPNGMLQKIGRSPVEYFFSSNGGVDLLYPNASREKHLNHAVLVEDAMAPRVERYREMKKIDAWFSSLPEDHHALFKVTQHLPIGTNVYPALILRVAGRPTCICLLMKFMGSEYLYAILDRRTEPDDYDAVLEATRDSTRLLPEDIIAKLTQNILWTAFANGSMVITDESLSGKEAGSPVLQNTVLGTPIKFYLDAQFPQPISTRSAVAEPQPQTQPTEGLWSNAWFEQLTEDDYPVIQLGNNKFVVIRGPLGSNELGIITRRRRDNKLVLGVFGTPATGGRYEGAVDVYQSGGLADKLQRLLETKTDSPLREELRPFLSILQNSAPSFDEANVRFQDSPPVILWKPDSGTKTIPLEMALPPIDPKIEIFNRLRQPVIVGLKALAPKDEAGWVAVSKQPNAWARFQDFTENSLVEIKWGNYESPLIRYQIQKREDFSYLVPQTKVPEAQGDLRLIAGEDGVFYALPEEGTPFFKWLDQATYGMRLTITLSRQDNQLKALHIHVQGDPNHAFEKLLDTSLQARGALVSKRPFSLASDYNYDINMLPDTTRQSLDLILNGISKFYMDNMQSERAREWPYADTALEAVWNQVEKFPSVAAPTGPLGQWPLIFSDGYTVSLGETFPVVVSIVKNGNTVLPKELFADQKQPPEISIAWGKGAQPIVYQVVRRDESTGPGFDLFPSGDPQFGPLRLTRDKGNLFLTSAPDTPFERELRNSIRPAGFQMERRDSHIRLHASGRADSSFLARVLTILETQKIQANKKILGWGEWEMLFPVSADAVDSIKEALKQIQLAWEELFREKKEFKIENESARVVEAVEKFASVKLPQTLRFELPQAGVDLYFEAIGTFPGTRALNDLPAEISSDTRMLLYWNASSTPLVYSVVREGKQLVLTPAADGMPSGILKLRIQEGQTVVNLEKNSDLARWVEEVRIGPRLQVALDEQTHQVTATRQGKDMLWNYSRANATQVASQLEALRQEYEAGLQARAQAPLVWTGPPVAYARSLQFEKKEKDVEAVLSLEQEFEGATLKFTRVGRLIIKGKVLQEGGSFEMDQPRQWALHERTGAGLEAGWSTWIVRWVPQEGLQVDPSQLISAQSQVVSPSDDAFVLTRFSLTHPQTHEVEDLGYELELKISDALIQKLGGDKKIKEKMVIPPAPGNEIKISHPLLGQLIWTHVRATHASPLRQTLIHDISIDGNELTILVGELLASFELKSLPNGDFILADENEAALLDELLHVIGGQLRVPQNAEGARLTIPKGSSIQLVSRVVTDAELNPPAEIPPAVSVQLDALTYDKLWESAHPERAAPPNALVSVAREHRPAEFVFDPWEVFAPDVMTSLRMSALLKWAELEDSETPADIFQLGFKSTATNRKIAAWVKLRPLAEIKAARNMVSAYEWVIDSAHPLLISNGDQNEPLSLDGLRIQSPRGFIKIYTLQDGTMPFRLGLVAANPFLVGLVNELDSKGAIRPDSARAQAKKDLAELEERFFKSHLWGFRVAAIDSATQKTDLVFEDSQGYKLKILGIGLNSKTQKIEADQEIFLEVDGKKVKAVISSENSSELLFQVGERLFIFNLKDLFVIEKLPPSEAEKTTALPLQGPLALLNQGMGAVSAYRFVNNTTVVETVEVPLVDAKLQGMAFPEDPEIEDVESADQLKSVLENLNLQDVVLIPDESTISDQIYTGTLDPWMTFTGVARGRRIILQIRMRWNESKKNYEVAVDAAGWATDVLFYIQDSDLRNKKHFYFVNSDWMSLRQTLSDGRMRLEMSARGIPEFNYNLDQMRTSVLDEPASLFGFMGKKIVAGRASPPMALDNNGHAPAAIRTTAKFFRLNQVPLEPDFRVGLDVEYEGDGETKRYVLTGVEIVNGRTAFLKTDGSGEVAYYVTKAHSPRKSPIYLLEDPQTGLLTRTLVITPNGRILLRGRASDTPQFYVPRESVGFKMATLKVAKSKKDGNDYGGARLSVAEQRPAAYLRQELQQKWNVPKGAKVKEIVAVLARGEGADEDALKLDNDIPPKVRFLVWQLRTGPLNVIPLELSVDGGEKAFNGEEIKLVGENEWEDGKGTRVRAVISQDLDAAGAKGRVRVVIRLLKPEGAKHDPKALMPYTWLEFDSDKNVLGKKFAVARAHYHEALGYQSKKLLPEDAGFLFMRAGAAMVFENVPGLTVQNFEKDEDGRWWLDELRKTHARVSDVGLLKGALLYLNLDEAGFEVDAQNRDERLLATIAKFAWNLTGRGGPGEGESVGSVGGGTSQVLSSSGAVLQGEQALVQTSQVLIQPVTLGKLPVISAGPMDVEEAQSSGANTALKQKIRRTQDFLRKALDEGSRYLTRDMMQQFEAYWSPCLMSGNALDINELIQLDARLQEFEYGDAGILFILNETSLKIYGKPWLVLQLQARIPGVIVSPVGGVTNSGFVPPKMVVPVEAVPFVR